MRVTRWRFVFAAGAALLLQAVAMSMALAATASVSIAENNGHYIFSPSNATAQAGSKVVWTNISDAPHTVTADDDSFDSGSLSENGTFEQTFDAPGEYGYHCEIHSYMHAKVAVVAADASQPATDAAPAGTAGGGPTTWLPILAAVAALIVFAVLGQRALGARNRPGSSH